MLAAELNALLTQTGPDTPGGRLLRKYWQPVALRRELPADGPPLHVRLLSEDLVLFRDHQGLPGLLGLHCPHRGADLSYGRVESGGIRCIYHGWQFTRDGECVERPNLPDGRTGKADFRHLAYPCAEVGDVILAYMGEGSPPPVPNFEFLLAPDGYRHSHKFFHECNYLQANEGNLDPSHTSFLHRNSIRPDSYATVRGASRVVDDLFTAQVNPSLTCEETAYGFRLFSVRRITATESYLRVTNFVFPNLSAIAGFEGRAGKGGYTASWHVPIDDFSHFRYDLTFQETGPVDAEFYDAMIREETDGFRLRRNRSNRYRQDRNEMKDRTFSGMGSFFPAQDAAVVESQGCIQDRTKEKLEASDIGIARARHMLLDGIRAVEQGGAAPKHPAAAGNDYSELVVLSEVINAATAPAEHVKVRIAEKKQRNLTATGSASRANVLMKGNA